jgi:hypothetical protein
MDEDWGQTMRPRIRVTTSDHQRKFRMKEKSFLSGKKRVSLKESGKKGG